MTEMNEMVEWLLAHAQGSVMSVWDEFNELFAAEFEHERFEAGRRAALTIEQRAQDEGAEPEGQT
jgi:hypothetical protein